MLEGESFDFYSTQVSGLKYRKWLNSSIWLIDGILTDDESEWTWE